MDLRQLRTLVTLAKLNNITKTAETLHLSAAAIHKQLKNLEEELETPLYEKVGRQLRLTTAAQVLLPHATDLLVRYDTTLQVLRDWKGDKKAVVRLGSGPGISIALLPELLAEFRSRYPDIEVVVETGSSAWLIENLREGALDLAIMVRSEVAAGDRIVEEVSWKFDIALVTANAGLPARCALRELAPVPFILFKTGSQVQRAIDAYMAQHDFHPRVSMRFDNVEAIKVMLKVGTGVSMLPRWAVVQDVRNGGLKLIRQAEPPLRSRIILAVWSERYLSTSVRALIETARQHRYTWLRQPDTSPTIACASRTPEPDRRPERIPPAPGPRCLSPARTRREPR